MIARNLAGLLLLMAPAALPQTAPPLPSFEVASVKPAPPPTDGRMMVRMGGDPGRVDYTNVSMKDILMRAFEVKRYQISGPSWLDSERFDVVAKVPAGTPREQVPLMLQQLLIERFKISMHREKKELPVYALVAGKNGPKLQKSEDDPASAPGGPEAGFGGTAGGRGGPAVAAGVGPGGGRGGAAAGGPPGGGRGMFRIGPGKIEAKRVTMAGFADMLSNLVDRPVIDETGVQGTYDLSLDVSMEEMGLMKGLRMPGPPPGHEGGPRPEASPAPESAPGASIFTVIQQLGLKLEGRKAPVDLVVIDHAEKVPTEN